MKKGITLLLPTYNCAAYVRPTLESVKWADEILVVDSFSTDGTLEVVQSYGARVVQHEYINSAKQKNWALQFIETEWTLQIDTDEVLEEGAESEIRTLIDTCLEEVQCFRFPRKNHMLGKWVRFGGFYPDFENRLFRTREGQWFDREVHSNIRVSGKYEYLQSHILHYGMPNISKQLRNLDRYTRYEADELKKRGLSFSYLRWLLFPILIFFYRFLWLQGFRDGWRGFFLAVYTAFYYFLSWSKLKELEVLKLDGKP